jgi:hypothetical protein
MEGLLRNTDGELVRRFERAMKEQDRYAERTLSLFLILTRFAKTSYESACFISADADDGSRRRKEFVLILPPINRQLIDMLFNIVYITDDFPSRSLEYELYGYRQLREQYDQMYARFGEDRAKRRLAQLSRVFFSGGLMLAACHARVQRCIVKS